MNIVFLGYGEYGAASLHGLLQDKQFNIQLVISHPNNKGDSDGAKVIELARSNGIPVLQSIMLAEEYIREKIHHVAPDVIVSTNWRTKIPSDIFSLGRLGTLNIHDALLPNYGGLSAEQWVILKDEKQTGVTVHLVTDLMDAGPIVHQISFGIEEDDSAEIIAKKQLNIYPSIICAALKRLNQPNFEPRTIEPSEYVRFHKLSRQDARICFDKSPSFIARQMRAWSGKFGGCWFEIDNQKYGVTHFSLSDIVLAGRPGRVVTHTDDGVWIVTAPCEHTGHSGIVIKDVLNAEGKTIDARRIISKNRQLD